MGMNEQVRRSRLAPVLLGVAATFGVADAQERSPNELVKALQGGGFVLVMRHASSPRQAPSKEVANADNTKLEPQLDETGMSLSAGAATLHRVSASPLDSDRSLKQASLDSNRCHHAHPSMPCAARSISSS
jgi:hypothetical protein